MDDQYNTEWKQWKVSDELANRGREKQIKETPKIVYEIGIPHVLLK